MNDLIRGKLKEAIELQDIIKKDDLNYKSKRGKLIILVNIHWLLFFQEIYMKDIHQQKKLIISKIILRMNKRILINTQKRFFK